MIKGHLVVGALGWRGASVLLSTGGATEPAVHFLMSDPRNMSSGQAQVNFADRWLIRGAGRQRNSQPPFMLLLSLHQFVPDKNTSYPHTTGTCGGGCGKASYNDVSLPVGCLRSWYSIMSSGWSRFTANIAIPFPVRRLALITALWSMSVQNTWFCENNKNNGTYFSLNRILVFISYVVTVTNLKHSQRDGMREMLLTD